MRWEGELVSLLPVYATFISAFLSFHSRKFQMALGSPVDVDLEGAYSYLKTA